MSLTSKTIGGFFWAFMERVGTQALQITIFIVLARLLTPEAFGLMGMLAVFIVVSQNISDSGFGQALIQKKDADEIDYSSVFYLNLVISVLMFAAIYIAAPFIASFYGEPVLIELIRVLGLRFIFSAFSMVQVARLTKQIKFKKLMIVKLPSTLIGGFAGITAAYLGFGVWSLIIQQLVDSALYSIQIWIQSRWKPQLVFSFNRVKVLFSFGSRIMIERVLSGIYQNFYEVMIGRNFSTADVGLYSIARKINRIPIKNLSTTLSNVTYPILSVIQDQDTRLKSAYKQIIRLAFFVVTPVMVLLIIIAEPLFDLVLSDTWLPAVSYFQWLCVGAVLYPVQLYNLNILKVKGRSDLFLNIGIVKKIIGVSGILFFVQYSVMALVIFKTANAFVAYFINSFFSGRLINYGAFEQIKDIWKFIGAATIAGVATFIIVELLQLHHVLTIILATLTILSIYLLLIRISEREILLLSKELFYAARKKIS